MFAGMCEEEGGWLSRAEAGHTASPWLREAGDECNNRELYFSNIVMKNMRFTRKIALYSKMFSPLPPNNNDRLIF